MGRKVTDGNAVDVTAPAGHIEFGELYRIDNFTGFAMDDIAADETDRGLSLEITHSLWRCKVPSGTCGTRGAYVKWSTTAGFKSGALDLADVAIPADGGVPALSVAKVEGVRNSGGYATLRLVDGG